MSEIADGPGPRLEVGRTTKAHGLKGEVLLVLASDRTDRLDPGSVLYLDDEAHEVVTAHRHQDRWRVRFAGVDDRTAAEALRGRVVTADPLPSDDGEIWVHEVIGAEVALADGSVVGTVAEVQANPAHDLLVLDDGTLVPEVFVTDASGLPERVVIDPPEGLLDLG